MAIQGTQVYTNTHYFCIFQIFPFYLFIFNWMQKNKQTNKKHFKMKQKLDANAWRRRRITPKRLHQLFSARIQIYDHPKVLWRVRMPSLTKSRMKWCLISICLVQECWTGFLEMLMALILSQYMMRCFWQIP